MGADSSAAQIAASAILINSLIYRISQTNPPYQNNQINEYEIQAALSLISHPFRRGRQGRHTLNLACSWLWCWRHPFLCSRSASKKADGWTDIWKLQERRRQPLLHWVLFRQLFFLNNFRHLDIFHPAPPSSFNSALRDLGLCFSPLTFVFISSR